MKRVSMLLALAGVGVVLLLLAWFDVGAVWAALLAVGWGGLGVLLVWQGLLFLWLGAASRVVMPGIGWGLLVWARMVRDAATTCLPFSPVGGYVLGARALALEGVAWPTGAAGTVVDVTAEILAQLAFALFGVAVLVLLRPGSGLAGPLGAGVVVVFGVAVMGVWQRGRVGRGLRVVGARLLGAWFSRQEGLGRLEGELVRLFVPGRLALASVVHLGGWFATGVGTWISLRLLGLEIGVMPVLALEALLDALVAAAFVVPGAAGVQEAGYVGFGALFGVPPELALGVSLLRRGRDLVWGVPILLGWQAREVRRLAAGGVRADGGGADVGRADGGRDDGGRVGRAGG